MYSLLMLLLVSQGEEGGQGRRGEMRRRGQERGEIGRRETGRDREDKRVLKSEKMNESLKKHRCRGGQSSDSLWSARECVRS